MANKTKKDLVQDLAAFEAKNDRLSKKLKVLFDRARTARDELVKQDPDILGGAGTVVRRVQLDLIQKIFKMKS